MACRLRNTGKHPLRVDLRGGETVMLGPGGTSPALREELLYGNTFVAEWEASGVLKRLPASMAEVLEREKPRAAPPSAAATPAGKPDERDAEGAGEMDDERPDGDAARTGAGRPRDDDES